MRRDVLNQDMTEEARVEGVTLPRCRPVEIPRRAGSAVIRISVGCAASLLTSAYNKRPGHLPEVALSRLSELIIVAHLFADHKSAVTIAGIKPLRVRHRAAAGAVKVNPRSKLHNEPPCGKLALRRHLCLRPAPIAARVCRVDEGYRQKSSHVRYKLADALHHILHHLLRFPRAPGRSYTLLNTVLL